MTSKSGRERLGKWWLTHRPMFAWLFWLCLVPVVAMLWVQAYIPKHPEQAEWFGYALPAIAALAWLTLVVGARLGARRDDTTSLPSARESQWVERVRLAGLVLGIAAFVYGCVLEWRRGRGVADKFPDVVIGAAKGWVVALALCGAIWIFCAWLPAWLAYAKRRLRPGVVDVVVDQGGTHAVRVLYRPTLGLGGVLRLRVNRGQEVLLGPGQSVGFLVPERRCTVAISGGPGRKMSASVELVAGRASEVTLCRGWWPRLGFRHREAGAPFVVTPRAFVSLWTGAGSFEWPRERRRAVTLRASERDRRGSLAWARREPRKGT